MRRRTRAAVWSAFLACASGAALFALPPEATQDLHWRLLGPMRGGWSTCVEGVAGRLHCMSV